MLRWNGKSIETVHRLGNRLKNLKQAIDPGQLQNDRGGGRNGREFEVAIPLHGLLHAMKQHVHARTIHLTDLGEIKDQTGTVSGETGGHVTEKILNVSHLQLCRQLFDYDRSLTCHMHVYLLGLGF